MAQKIQDTVVEFQLEDGSKAWGAPDSRAARDAEARKSSKGRSTPAAKRPAPTEKAEAPAKAEADKG